MKKYFIVILIILSLGALSWAQGSKDLFDANKSQADLEIMKGILSTTISYVEQNQQKNAWRLNTSNMSAYYLVGQGAVFVIPTSALRPIELTPFFNGQDIKLNLDLSKLKEQTRAIEMLAQKRAAEVSKRATGDGIGSGVGSGIGNGVGSGLSAPAVPPIPPAPPAPPAPPQVDREELRKKVEQYQIEIKKSREEAAANQAKFLESLAGIRVFLIEALANYGDSLTQVKPGEYINLILYTDSFDSNFGRMKTRYDVISAQKSWITDCKAGRISLENFKQKVLQYTE